MISLKQTSPNVSLDVLETLRYCGLCNSQGIRDHMEIESFSKENDHFQVTDLQIDGHKYTSDVQGMSCIRQ